jgi:hypothetical protein
MDSDDDLRAAIETNAVFAVVHVISVARDKVGTRSQTTGYTCELVRALDTDSLPSPVVLKHFGPPLLTGSTRWIVGAVDSRRHHDAWELRFATSAGADGADLEQSTSAFLGRRNAL